MRRVNRACYVHWVRRRRRSAVLLQRWYKRYRLVDREPPLRVTRRTLLRYYVTKYRLSWLRRFPATAIAKLSYLPSPGVEVVRKYLQPTMTMNLAAVRTFLQFVDDFHLEIQDLGYYGW